MTMTKINAEYSCRVSEDEFENEPWVWLGQLQALFGMNVICYCNQSSISSFHS